MTGSDNKGLFSIDALLALTLAFSVAMTFLNIYEGRNQAAQLMAARLEAKMVGEKLAAAINAVYANGENFELRVNLPENLVGYSYRINFDNLARQILVENSAWGIVRVTVPFENVLIPALGYENFENALRVYWPEWRENWVVVVSA